MTIKCESQPLPPNIFDTTEIIRLLCCCLPKISLKKLEAIIKIKERKTKMTSNEFEKISNKNK